MKKCAGVTHRGHEAVSYCIFAVGLMTHLSRNMDWDPGAPLKARAKTLMVGD